MTKPAFWPSLGTVNTFSLYLYLCYCKKNFNRASGSFGLAEGIFCSTVSPKYSISSNLTHTCLTELYQKGSPSKYHLITTIANIIPRACIFRYEVIAKQTQKSGQESEQKNFAIHQGQTGKVYDFLLFFWINPTKTEI